MDWIHDGFQLPEYLYHGTFGMNLPSIFRNGLGATVHKRNRNWPSYSRDDVRVYLHSEPLTAYEWGSSGLREYLRNRCMEKEDLSESDGRLVLLEIRLEDLDLEHLYYDRNLHSKWANYFSFEYRKVIPPNVLKIVDPEEADRRMKLKEMEPRCSTQVYVGVDSKEV